MRVTTASFLRSLLGDHRARGGDVQSCVAHNYRILLNLDEFLDDEHLEELGVVTPLKTPAQSALDSVSKQVVVSVFL